jgi:hypothetical protein
MKSEENCFKQALFKEIAKQLHAQGASESLTMP